MMTAKSLGMMGFLMGMAGMCGCGMMRPAGAIREKIKAWGGDATRQEINQIRMIDQKRWPLKAARDSANRTA